MKKKLKPSPSPTPPQPSKSRQSLQFLQKRHEKLKQKVAHHGHLYYVLDQPQVSDREYDQLFQKLQSMENQYGHQLDTKDSPTQRVGGESLSHFEKIPHITPMLSLSNTYSSAEMQAFWERCQKRQKDLKGNKEEEETKKPSPPLEFLCEPKLDGLAIELIYEKAVLTQAITRGDGQVGEGVLANIKTIPSIPLQLNPKLALHRLSVRGEVVMHEKDFLQLNEEQKKQGEPPFANARNATAGSVRQLNPKITAKRKLHFYAHSLGELRRSPSSSQAKNIPPITNQKDFLNYLKNLHLPISNFMAEKSSPSSSPSSSQSSFEHWQRTMEQRLKTEGWSPKLPLLYLCSHLEEMIAYKSFIQKYRNVFPFAIDGIVIKINAFSLQEKMGHIARSPRWAMAAKFPEAEAVTQVKDIQLQVGRTGVLTPVAHLKPVALAGVTIHRASLHNQEEIRRKDIRIHDWVSIKRAGDVIPQVVSVRKEKRPSKTRPFVFSKKCPNCPQKIHLLEDEQDKQKEKQGKKQGDLGKPTGQTEQAKQKRKGRKGRKKTKGVEGTERRAGKKGKQGEKKGEGSSFYTSSIQYRGINPLCSAMLTSNPSNTLSLAPL